MTAEEQEFVRRLESVGKDVEDCATHVFQELAFHHIAATEQKIRSAVEEHWPFFSAVLSAHQAAAFVALHRLYETKAAHENLGALLKCAQTNLHIFKADAFAARRRESGWSENAVANSLHHVFEPDKGSFADLRDLCVEGRQKYEESARDIRHELFGHSGTRPFEERVRLFEQLKVRDFERIAVIPSLVHSELEKLFNSGYKPNAAMPLTDIPSVVEAARAGDISTPHFRAARQVSDFLSEYAESAAHTS